jgi:VanZ family protein
MISYCLLVTYVIAVTALSLKPTVDIQSIPYNDKLAHCLTYALFTFFVWRLSHSHFRFLLYALLVFTYSVLIEFIQPFTGRMLSGWDMVANGVGVIFMVLALYRVPLPIIK